MKILSKFLLDQKKLLTIFPLQGIIIVLSNIFMSILKIKSFSMNFIGKIFGNFMLLFLFVLFCVLVLSLSLRGMEGNPTSMELNNSVWKEDGPFELSPERGRFALLYSLVEDRSLYFSDDLGKFAIPDVGVNNGRYVSLFAPGLSFLTMPGYIIGRYFDLSQVGAFATVAVFAVLNVILLRLIAIRLGADKIPATIASFIFIFATPAFTYASTLYQHHISTFLILISIYLLLKSNRVWTIAIVFFAFALSIPLDYPNLFLMFPILIFALGKIFSFENKENKFSIRINILKFISPIVAVIPILLFLFYNQLAYGNPFQLSGTLETAKEFQSSDTLEVISRTQILEETETDDKNATGFFVTRNLLEGFYIHFISLDRGLIYYTPVMLFGIIGFILALKKKVKMTTLFAAIIGSNILLYSMWGDPWGGWAFGSRYLIPSYAILSVFIALLLTYWKKLILIIPFALVAVYSVSVNTLGAITTSAIPPQVQVLALEELSGIVQKYTYERSWDLLASGNSKSFAYQTFLERYISSVQFYQMLAGSISLVILGLIIYYFLFKKEIKNV